MIASQISMMTSIKHLSLVCRREYSSNILEQLEPSFKTMKISSDTSDRIWSLLHRHNSTLAKLELQLDSMPNLEYLAYACPNLVEFNLRVGFGYHWLTQPTVDFGAKVSLKHIEKLKIVNGNPVECENHLRFCLYWLKIGLEGHL